MAQTALPPAHGVGDAFCRVVRLEIGRGEVEAMVRADGSHPSKRRRRDALERAIVEGAWNRVMPEEPSSAWVRVVQPIEPPLANVAPDRQLLVMVAGLRRPVAEAAARGEEAATSRLAAACESFGEPRREEIANLLTLASH